MVHCTWYTWYIVPKVQSSEIFFQYLKLARTQKFYSYIRLKPCVMDFPESDSHATINVGGFELSFHIVGTQVYIYTSLFVFTPFVFLEILHVTCSLSQCYSLLLIL